MQAKVDDKRIAYGLDHDPVTFVENLEARHGAGEDKCDEVPVAVRWQAKRHVRRRARRVPDDTENHIAGTLVAVEIVRREPQALTEHVQQLQPKSSHQCSVVFINIAVVRAGRFDRYTYITN